MRSRDSHTPSDRCAFQAITGVTVRLLPRPMTLQISLPEASRGLACVEVFDVNGVTLEKIDDAEVRGRTVSVPLRRRGSHFVKITAGSRQYHCKVALR